VDGKDISHSLTKEYPFSNSKKLPSSEYLNRLDGRRIVSILEFAWKSRGNLFEHNVIWDDLKTKEDAWAVDAHNACKVSKILENLLCYVKWKDGCTTWESGLAVTQFVGRTAFILCMGLGFRRTIQKWQHLQTSKAASTSQGFEVDNTEILRNSGDDSSECEGSAVSIGGKTPRRPLRYQKWTASNSWIEAVKGANPRDAFDSLLSDFDSMSRKGGIKVRCVGLMVKSDEQDGVRIARKMNRETVAATAKLFHHLLPKDPANVLNVAYLW
jgi:hypothetical protein